VLVASIAHNCPEIMTRWFLLAAQASNLKSCTKKLSHLAPETTIDLRAPLRSRCRLVAIHVRCRGVRTAWTNEFRARSVFPWSSEEHVYCVCKRSSLLPPSLSPQLVKIKYLLGSWSSGTWSGTSTVFRGSPASLEAVSEDMALRTILCAASGQDPWPGKPSLYSWSVGLTPTEARRFRLEARALYRFCSFFRSSSWSSFSFFRCHCRLSCFLMAQP